MRDVLAGAIALLLLAVAASLATALQQYRRRRQRARHSERALGRTILAEIPTEDDLVLFSEDDKRFYYGERSIDKDLIVAARVLINGAAMASCVSRRTARFPATKDGGPGAAEVIGAEPTAPEVGMEDGITRDRWDVAIDTGAGTTIVPCGAIREGVSQELARAVFDAVRREIERRDAA